VISFDNVNQDRLMEFLAHRIADKRVLRYIKRFLKAGIQEDGCHRASDRGVPQGGVIRGRETITPQFRRG
jgi:RNA-directed DNA polymerase